MTLQHNFAPLTGPAQHDIIRKHLDAGKTITQGQAQLVYGISRLSSCIERLREQGVEIDSVVKFDEVGKQYGEYRLRRAIKLNCMVQVKRGHGFGLPSYVRKTRGAKVVGLVQDVAYVQFDTQRGPKTVPMNVEELLYA